MFVFLIIFVINHNPFSIWLMVMMILDLLIEMLYLETYRQINIQFIIILENLIGCVLDYKYSLMYIVEEKSTGRIILGKLN